MPLAIARRRPLPQPTPAADPRFRKVMDNLKQGAARTKKHEPAAKKASQASAAAKGPAHEKLATGKAKQVDKIQEAPEKKPDENSFLNVLRAEIQKAMPKTLGDTEDFMKGGSKEELKGGLEGNVSKQKEEAEGGVKSASKEPPKETGEAKVEQPIPPEGAPAPPVVNAADGMPTPKTDADVSLQDSKQDTESQMKEAEVTPIQLQKAKDPRFSAVLSAKDAVAKQADSAPATYRGAEKGVLSVAAAAATGQARKGAAAMVGVRAGSNSAVLSKQALAKKKEEQERQAVTDHIEQIYNKTKETVEQKLSSLETEVGAMFDAGVDAAVNGMTDFVNARMDAYKDDRYSGILGGARWLKDKLLGLPKEADRFYVEGRLRFTQLMDALVVKVAALVETRLKEAKDEVAKGQAEIKSYVDGLAPNLKSVGNAAAKEIEGRFTELTQSIESKKNDLAQQLAQKYKESFSKANDALKKIQDANKGLVTAFVEKLGEIIKILREFKDKLLAMLKKAAGVIGDIIADPIGFLGHLIDAIKLGIQQFVSNIWTHLKNGFMAWLFGSLADAGIELPKDLTLPSILKLVLAVLGITYDRMRAKAVKLLGPKAVAIIEKIVEYVKALITGGPAKLWELVKEDLGNLKQMVIDALQDWIITTIVKKATVKLISLFNPAGAIIQAIMLIYDTVTFLISNASKILSFVEAVIDSVAAIVSGAIGTAANWIEQALARTIPLIIGFLADLLGLGGISKKIKEFIEKVQNTVDKAIDKAIAKVAVIVKKLFGKGTAPNKTDEVDEEKSAKVKADAIADIKSRSHRLTSAAELDALIGSVYEKHSKDGLKSIRIATGPEGSATILVSASAEVIADEVRWLFSATSPRKVIAKVAINGYVEERTYQSFEGVHAEESIVRDWPQILRRFNAVSNNKPITRIEIFVKYSPCRGTCAPRLMAIAAQYPTAAFHVYYGEIYVGRGGREFENSVDAINTMQARGIKIAAFDLSVEVSKIKRGAK